MARQEEKLRVWPWAVVLIAGLLTTSGGEQGTEVTGWLITAGAIAMIIRAAHRNSAARHAAGTRRPGFPQGSRRHRRAGTARNLRRLIRLVP